MFDFGVLSKKVKSQSPGGVKLDFIQKKVKSVKNVKDQK